MRGVSLGCGFFDRLPHWAVYIETKNMAFLDESLAEIY